MMNQLKFFLTALCVTVLTAPAFGQEVWGGKFADGARVFVLIRAPEAERPDSWTLKWEDEPGGEFQEVIYNRRTRGGHVQVALSLIQFDGSSALMYFEVPGHERIDACRLVKIEDVRLEDLGNVNPADYGWTPWEFSPRMTEELIFQKTAQLHPRNERLREAFEQFPLVAPHKDEFGRQEFTTLDLHASSIVVNGIRYGGFRFVADREEEQDFYWTFLGPSNQLDWSFLPQEGEFEYRRNLLQRRHRGSYRRSQGLEPRNHTGFVLQRIHGDYFEPGMTYLAWFQLGDDEPALTTFSFVFAPRTRSGTVRAVEQALDLRRPATVEDPRLRELQMLYNEATAVYDRHDRGEAVQLFQTLLEKAIALDQTYYIYRSLTYLGLLEGRKGKPATAAELLEEALGYLRENERRTEISRHRDEWRILDAIVTQHLHRGALALAQAASWRSEQAIIDYISNQGTAYRIDCVSELDSRHLVGIPDISRLARMLDNRARLMAIAGDAGGALEAWYHVIDLIQNRPSVRAGEQGVLAIVYYSLALAYRDYGQPEKRDEVARLLREMDPEHAGGTQWRKASMTALRRLKARDGDIEKLSAQVEEFIAAADDDRLLAVLAGQSHLPHVMGYRGDVEGGLALINRLIAEAENSELGVASFWLARVEYCLDFGILDGVEDDLFRALDFFRSNGMILREPKFYHLYLRYLFARNRLDEIPAILRLAEARADRLKLEGLKQELHRDVARWSAEVAKQEFDEALSGRLDRESGTDDRATGGLFTGAIDMQPLEMVSLTMEGELARGRFVLTNTGMDTVDGVLHVNAPVLADAWNGAGDTWAVSLGGEGKGRSHSLALEPGARRTVYLESEIGKREETAEFQDEVELYWEGVTPQRAWWRFGQADGSTGRVSMVQASLAMENPFYPVSLFHEIFHRGSGEAVLDFRVRSSHPVYIEVVDIVSGRLLAIDSTGNGRFDGEGDAIFQNRNRNNFPDILMIDDEDVVALEVIVFPRRAANASQVPDEIRVHFELRDESGDWISNRGDLILTNP